jgi:hypothetical protein
MSKQIEYLQQKCPDKEAQVSTETNDSSHQGTIKSSEHQHSGFSDAKVLNVIDKVTGGIT